MGSHERIEGRMSHLKTTPEERATLRAEALAQRVTAAYERHDASICDPPELHPRNVVVTRILDDLDTLAAAHARALAIADMIEHDIARAHPPPGGQQVGPGGDLGPVPPSVRGYLERVVRDLRGGPPARVGELNALAARIAKGRAKYPNGCTVLSLLDECGEVAHAVNKYESADRVREELLDVAAVAMRLYLGEVDRGLEMDGLVQRRVATTSDATTSQEPDPVGAGWME